MQEKFESRQWSCVGNINERFLKDYLLTFYFTYISLCRITSPAPGTPQSPHLFWILCNVQNDWAVAEDAFRAAAQNINQPAKGQ